MNDPAHARKIRVQKQVLALIWPAAVLILLASVEVLLTVKDVDLFTAWVNAGGSGSFDQYLNMHLFVYLINILYPVSFALYTLWVLPRFGVTRYYKIVWIALGALSLFYRIVSFNLYSVFYYLCIIFYLILIFQLVKFKLNAKVTNP